VKTKSHIIPKFFAKSFLQDNGKNLGHRFTAAKTYYNVYQDSPKEDYLFCNECEKYISFIEHPASHFLENFHADNISLSEQKIVESSGVFVKSDFPFNPIIFHLFFYSLIFRSSISNHEAFVFYSLDKKDEEHLRVQLMKYFALDNPSFVLKLNQNRIEMLDYALVTCANYPTDTFGGIAARNLKKSPSFICANKFLIYTGNMVKHEMEKFYWNQDREAIKIIYWSFDTYKKSFLIPLFKNMKAS